MSLNGCAGEAGLRTFRRHRAFLSAPGNGHLLVTNGPAAREESLRTIWATGR
jgi:hypothetical protein